MSLLELHGLRVERGANRVVLHGVDLTAEAGELIALVGLNGAGKSTLLETIAGGLTGYGGACRLRGRDVQKWNRRELSKMVSYLPQTAPGQTGYAVREVVAMGRFPHSGGWVESPDDISAIESAMRTCHCDHLVKRPYDQLSGGEKQRVLMAAVLAQQTNILILDEPAAHVDLPQQIQMFALLRKQTETCGTLCLAATHDLNLAAAHATRLVLLHDGKVRYDGDPESLFSRPVFAEIFGPDVTVSRDAEGHLFASFRRVRKVQ
jgi:iron complex transport system ATP-binding protein